MIAFAAPSLAQEPGQLSTPPPSTPADFAQCKESFDSIWRTQDIVRKRIRVFDAAIQDYKNAQKALRDDRVWFGLTSADSQLAREGAAYLQAVSTTSSVLLTEMDRWNLLTSASDGFMTLDNVYRALKQGKSIRSMLNATSFSEELYRVALYLKGKALPPTVRMALTVGEDFHKTMQNDRAWQDYHAQIDRNMAQLDAYIASANGQIKKEEDRLYQSAKEGFDNFCAESMPPRAEPDEYSLAVGQVGEFPVTANDRDPDGGSVRVVTVRANTASPFLGSVSVKSSSDGIVKYVAPDKPGDYQFMYSILDGEGESAEAAVTIHVTESSSNSGSSGRDERVGDLEAELNSIVDSQLASFDAQWDKSMNDRAAQLDRALQQARDAIKHQGRSDLLDILSQVTALYNTATNGKNASALDCAEKLMRGQVNASCSTWAQQEASKQTERRQSRSPDQSASNAPSASKPKQCHQVCIEEGMLTNEFGGPDRWGCIHEKQVCE